MLQIFDKDHNAIGNLSRYADCKTESDLSTGDKVLSFVCLDPDFQLDNEMYVRTKDDEYVIKEVSEESGGFPEIVAALNLEELEAKAWSTFTASGVTITAAAQTALAGTGWTVGECDLTKERNVSMLKVSSLGVVNNLCTAFMCEPVFDTINKTVSFYEERGEDKGVYFLAGLNLKKLQKTRTSYDFYTRIIPIGEDDLTIESVNDGKNYLENFQYSDKIRTYIWEDTSYTDAEALMEDAEKKLEDLSKPEVSYSVEICDLSRQSGTYDVFSYSLGDTITIIDASTGTREKQRIKQITEYENHPEKNTCEIANTVLTFEELQEKLQAAAELVDSTLTGDGKIYVSDILNLESGITDSTTVKGILSDVSSAQESIEAIDNDISGIKASVGEIEANYLKAETADLKYATIVSLAATNMNVHDLSSDYADFRTLVATEAELETLEAEDVTVTGKLNAAVSDIDTLKTEKLSAEDAELKYANIDFTNIGAAAMQYFYSQSGLIENVVVGDQTITGELVGVTIKGDLIEGNTIVAEKLVIKGEDGLYYKLNTDGSSTEAEQTEYNSLNGQIIQAKSIAATKIDVEDLVAFGATIGGFNIGESSLYSGVKSTVDNTTRGIYMDTAGQVAIGDGSNYIKYYKDGDGNYRLAISAKSLVFSTSGTSVADELAELREELTTSLYISSSQGTVFKNDNISTVLSVVIYYGATRITDADALKEAMGDSVYLQWSFQRFNEDTIYTIDSSDSRIGNDGFTFTITGDDVDAKAIFMCDLMEGEADGN